MRALTSVFASAAIAFAAPALAQDVELSADDMLAPYYKSLAKKVRLPVAGKGAELAPSTVLTRIAVGSCNHQSRSQHMWAQIAAADPQLFLLIGDNNYGDQGWSGDAGLSTLRAAYAVQSTTPELNELRAKVPMMVTWDDHDFGFNDGGANFAFRTWSETIFETFWGSSETVKSRPGIYDSQTFGEEGKRTQVIMLDTRYFRSDFDRMPYQSQRPPLGSYVPSTDQTKTILGDAQWIWLAQELAKPADLRIVVSSIQVLTDAHNFESWEQLPLERQKLYAALSAREDSGLVMLSGDRHAGGVYKYKPANGAEQFWELTSSALNYSFSSTERNTAREPDDRRVTDLISEENFGLVDINWSSRSATLRLQGNKGEDRVQETFSW